MKKLSPLVKSLAICLIVILFTNSVGYAKAPTISNAQTRCGEWKIQSIGSNNDQRIGITLKSQASGNDCSGMFTLENRTGTILGGGYSLELKANSNNANVQYLPYGDPILIPGLNIEIKTIPNDPTKQANINLQGEVTLGSFLAVDLSFFAMKSIIDLAPVPTGCLISYDQLLLISLRTAPILENTARLAFEGKLLESKDEFSRVIDIYFEKAGDVARDIGIGCFADYLKSIIGKPIVIAKIVLSYTTWVPVVIFDYFKYQGFLTSVGLSYIPPTPPTPTPIPIPLLPETLMLDTRNSAINSSITLVTGHIYTVKISGTFSYWEPDYWKQYGICAGTPDSSPMFPSTGITNGPAGQDPFYFYAFPKGPGTTEICGKSKPPFLYFHLEISNDGGISYSVPNTSSGFNKSHTYEFRITGKGKPLSIKLNDSYYPDNRGQLKIEITP